MNEKEKKAIKELSLKSIRSSLEAKDYPSCIVLKKDLHIVLNLIEKQQAEIETLKDIKTIADTEIKEILNWKTELETLKRDFEIVDHECSRLEKEDIKKNIMINEMAEKIYEEGIIWESKNEVIEYFNQKIEKGE